MHRPERVCTFSFSPITISNRDSVITLLYFESIDIRLNHLSELVKLKSVQFDKTNGKS